MSLLFPLGLLALLALPTIVILHLIQERRRRVVVPSLLLWQMLPPNKQAEQPQSLPLTLLLLLHLLAAALLGLALAQPQWITRWFANEENIAIVIDTSTSMAASDPALGGKTRLAAAQERARSLIAGASERGTFTLIAAGPQAQVVQIGGAADIAGLQTALDTLTASGTGTDIAGALVLAQATLEDYPSGRVVVFTDGAVPTLASDAVTQPALQPVDWVVVGGPVDNRAVVTLTSRQRTGLQPGSQVFARVANYGSSAVSSSLRLYADDELLDTRPVDLLPESEAEFTWSLPADIDILRAELDGRDGLPADDTASLSLAQTRTTNTLLVSDEPAALERALRAVPGLTVNVIGPGAYAGSPLATAADLTIFENVVPSQWPAGGVLVVNPPVNQGEPITVEASPPTSRARAAGATRVELAVLPSAYQNVFDGLSLGSVDFGTTRTVEVPAWADVQLALGDAPLALRGRIGASEVAVWMFDVQRSNLPSRLAFPLLVARTARDLTPQKLPSAVALGETLRLQPGPRVTTVDVQRPDGTEIQLPVAAQDDNPVVQFAATQAGLYTVVERSGSEDIATQQIPANAGAAIESSLSPRPLPQQTQTDQATQQDTVQRSERPLWPWLVGLALAVVVGEWFYVHRAKKTRPTSASYSP